MMAANDIFKEKPEKIVASGLMLDTGMLHYSIPQRIQNLCWEGHQTGNLSPPFIFIAMAFASTHFLIPSPRQTTTQPINVVRP